MRTACALWMMAGLSGCVWTCPAPLWTFSVERSASSRWRQRESWLFIKFSSYSWYVEQISVTRFFAEYRHLFLKTFFFFFYSFTYLHEWRHLAINVYGVSLYICHILESSIYNYWWAWFLAAFILFIVIYNSSFPPQIFLMVQSKGCDCYGLL